MFPLLKNEKEGGGGFLLQLAISKSVCACCGGQNKLNLILEDVD